MHLANKIFKLKIYLVLINVPKMLLLTQTWPKILIQFAWKAFPNKDENDENISWK